MAQLVLIKDANTPSKKVGEVVGNTAFDDDHKFSKREHEAYTILKIPGYTAEELRAKLPIPKRSTAFRMPVANRWSFDDPEVMPVWLNEVANAWMPIAERPHSLCYLDALSQAEMDTLTSEVAPVSEKDAILEAKLLSRITDYPENVVAINELPPGESRNG